MAKRRNAYCRQCRRHRSEVGTLTLSGLCNECWPKRLEQNVRQMQAQRGPYVEYWAWKMAESVGLAPLDEAPPRP